MKTMKYIIQCDYHMKFSIVVLMLLTSIAFSQSKKYIKILTNKDFLKNFEYYYDALDDYELDVLVLELSDTVEDALISASHLTPASVKHKTRVFEDSLFGALKVELCERKNKKHQKPNFSAPNGVASSKDSIKTLIANCLIEVSKEQKLEISSSHYGMITGILVRIIEKVPRQKYCACEKFEELEKIK